jgi:hypothetical protein
MKILTPETPSMPEIAHREGNLFCAAASVTFVTNSF